MTNTKPELIRVISKKDDPIADYRKEAVENLKIWTRNNFIFNKGTVFYALPEDEKLSKLPEYFDKLKIKDWEKINTKKYYPTPLSHLISVCFKIGEYIAYLDADLAIKEITSETNS